MLQIPRFGPVINVVTAEAEVTGSRSCPTRPNICGRKVVYAA